MNIRSSVRSVLCPGDGENRKSPRLGRRLFGALFFAPIFHAAALPFHKAAVAVDRDPGQGVFQRGELGGGERDVPRAQIFRNAFLIFGTGDGDDAGLFVQHPAEEDLGFGGIFLPGKAVQQVQNGPVGGPIFRSELGGVFPNVVAVGKIRFSVTLPERKPLAMGEKGTKPM